MKKRLSEQLVDSIRSDPPNSSGLIVKLAHLSSTNYPGRDARGVFPVFVVGHEAMTEGSWQEWIRERIAGAYGAAAAAKLASQGVDLKDMLPSAAIGRQIVKYEGLEAPGVHKDRNLLFAARLIEMAEKWPQLYNLIAREMVEEEMTLSSFVDRIKQMPCPFDLGQGGVYSTLGDLIGREVILTPEW